MPRGALLKPRQEIGRDQGSLLRHVRLWHQDVMELQETAFQGMRGLPARRLRTLWTMLTHVHGSLLNVSDLARSLGGAVGSEGSPRAAPEGSLQERRHTLGPQQQDGTRCGQPAQPFQHCGGGVAAAAPRSTPRRGHLPVRAPTRGSPAPRRAPSLRISLYFYYGKATHSRARRASGPGAGTRRPCSIPPALSLRPGGPPARAGRAGRGAHGGRLQGPA